MTENAIQLEQQQELMKVLEFNYRDLEANREGRIGYQQGEEIWRRENPRWLRPLYWALFISIYPLLCLLPFGYIDYSNGSDMSGLYLLSGIAALVIFFYLWNAGINSWRLWKDIQEREVRQIQGLAEFSFTGIPILKINQQRFQTSREILRAIPHLQPNVIYYLPRSKAIVAVELMER